PRVLASALKPRAFAAARVIAQHVGMSTEAFGDCFDCVMHRPFISDVGLKTMGVSGDGRGWGSQLPVDDRNLIDDLFIGECGYSPQSESARSSGSYSVFHGNPFSAEAGQRKRPAATFSFIEKTLLDPRCLNKRITTEQGRLNS